MNKEELELIEKLIDLKINKNSLKDKSNSVYMLNTLERIEDIKEELLTNNK